MHLPPASTLRLTDKDFIVAIRESRLLDKLGWTPGKPTKKIARKLFFEDFSSQFLKKTSEGHDLVTFVTSTWLAQAEDYKSAEYYRVGISWMDFPLSLSFVISICCIFFLNISDERNLISHWNLYTQSHLHTFQTHSCSSKLSCSVFFRLHLTFFFTSAINAERIKLNLTFYRFIRDIELQ